MIEYCFNFTPAHLRMDAISCLFHTCVINVILLLLLLSSPERDAVRELHEDIITQLNHRMAEKAT